MSLKSKVNNIDEVDENVRGFYKETDNGFILDVEANDGYALEDVGGLRSALSKERALKQEAEKRAGQYSKLGDLDADTIEQKLNRLQELEALDPTKEADKIADAKLKSLQEQMSTKHQKELEALKGEAGKYQSQLNRVLIDDSAKSAILAAGGDADTVTFMLPYVKESLRLRDAGEGFITEVVDANGHPQIGDSNGNPMTVGQLVESMKSQATWSKAFPGKNKSGGGRSSDITGGTSGTSGVKRSEMTTKEKSAYVATHGQQAYFKLKP